MAEYRLELKRIHKTFQEKDHAQKVLNGIDLSVKEGEFLTLLGASGCGKTTLLRIIAGLETPDSGSVCLDGEDITTKEANLRDVRMVFQNYALFPHMNVAKNIGYGLKVRKEEKHTIAKRVEEMLQMVELSGYGDRMPSQLSGGQRQRVAIARAMITSPKILLLDEPLGALDLKLRRQMQLELKRLQKKLGMTFIYITHDQEEAINMSDRIAVMHEGVFEQIGTPNEIYYHPKTSYVASFVGDANLVTIGGRRFAIRTENVLFDLKSDGETGYVATVTEKHFAGGKLRIFMQLEDGQQMSATRFGIDYDVNVGEKINIFWNAEDAIEVDDEKQ